MLINRSYVFRLYPNKEQINLINKTMGCTRFVYNYYLSIEKNKEKRININKLKMMYPFLKKVNIFALHNAIFSLDNALNNFYQNNKGYPKFKSKGVNESFKIPNIICKFNNKNTVCLNMLNHTISLPNLENIPIRGYNNLKELKCNIRSATIRSVAGKYYVSILVEEDIPIPVVSRIKNMVGLDLGIKNYVVTSHNEKIKNTVYINEKRLAGLQKALARSQKQSKNREKLKLKIECLFQKIKNAKKQLIYGIVNHLVKENDFLATETLDIPKMKQNHSIAKSLTNVSFYELIRILKYKCMWAGKIFIQVPKYYASSRICSKCGYKNEIVKDLSVRNWICPKCGSHHDRDYNASINIRNKGYEMYLKTCKN